jgi:UDP-hydrolysing UDP-N-acetyl-D-glucosamine 2-epimerase|tara:strand:- start:786 stop:1943 length:1158 start_codon:yes stop_codon:yes gene_type:complete
MKRICVFVGSRANYSSIKSVMKSVQAHPKLELQIVLGVSAILDRFGKVEDLIRSDGFKPDFIFHNLIEGENPATMAKSTGLGLMDASMIFDNLKPDMLVVVGDRFEMMSVTLAAAYMNIRIIHTMGGEVTGTIDESIRHAITKFAHIHFPANEESRQRIIKMGEDERYVFNVGCPRTDLVADELKNNSHETLRDLFQDYGGVGEEFNLSQPYLLVSQHSVTTEYNDSRYQIEETLKALDELKLPTIMLWPNADAGGDDISKGIRTYREKNNPTWLHLFKNLPTHIYIHLMNTTVCLVGNSSSGIREGAFIGTPVVNIGTRQNKRLRAENVIQAPYSKKEIINAIKTQINHGKYESSDIYGDGTAGEKIADILVDCEPSIQKTIVY